MAKLCPLCNKPGQNVPQETVASMVQGGCPEGSVFWICLTSNCRAAYYGENEEVWLQEQVRVPIAFKDGAKPKYVCYCSGVTEQDIINAVLSKKAVTLAQAIEVTGAMRNGNCLTNNPAGKCCSSDFKEVFDKALEMVKF